MKHRTGVLRMHWLGWVAVTAVILAGVVGLAWLGLDMALDWWGGS